MKGIILHSIVPLRLAPSEGAEQQTQLLFGETCDILQQDGRWIEVRNDADGQTGWVDFKMLTEMTDNEAAAYTQAYAASTAIVRMPMAYAVSGNNQVTIPLTMGTRLPNYLAEAKDGRPAGSFEVLGVPFMIDPQMVLTAPLPLSADSLMQVSRFLLNTPYLWGGKNALGMDCSGLTQVVMSLMGVSLLRNASEQAKQGKAVEWEQAEACDLVFFDHPTEDGKGDGRVSHVGILLTKDAVIHCSGRVKVEKIDREGIISSENNTLYKVGDHTHHLCAIRRFA